MSSVISKIRSKPPQIRRLEGAQRLVSRGTFFSGLPLHASLLFSREPGRKLLDLLRQLGQPAEVCVHLFEFAQRTRGRAPHNAAFPHRLAGRDARLSSNHSAIFNSDMIGHTDLTRQSYKVANLGASGNSSLRGNHRVAANPDVVSYLHEVVDLGAFGDPRGSERAAVDRCIRADLNIVLDHQSAKLRKLLLAALGEQVTEPVRPQNGACMQYDTVAHFHARIDAHPGMEHAARTQ